MVVEIVWSGCADKGCQGPMVGPMVERLLDGVLGRPIHLLRSAWPTAHYLLVKQSRGVEASGR